MQRDTGSVRGVVYVTVSGGVAYPSLVPVNVELHILDFDDLKADREGTMAKYTAEERAFILSLEESGR